MQPIPTGSAARSAEEKRALLAKLLQKGAPQRSPLRRRMSAFEAQVSFAQQRLWFFEQLMPGSSVYNIMIPCRLAMAVSAEVLLDAINEVVARHEALRTTFRVIDGTPVQRIAPELRLDMPRHDLQGLTDEERQAATERIFTALFQAPYDLTRGPLLRAHLLQYGGEDFLLMICMHHIVSDAWSTNVLIEELSAIYDAFSKGQPSPLAPLLIQYPDFAVWQRDWLSGEVLERQLDYWKRQLDGIVPIDLPCDHPRPANMTFRGKYVLLGANAALVGRLRALSAMEECTFFMTLLAAFQVFLFRHTGQEDVVVGTPVANRNHADVEKLIGFFVNSLVLRTTLEGNPTFREVMARTRETALAAYVHQDIPFEMLVEHLQPERDLTRNPIFQVLFQVQTIGSNREIDAPPGGQLHNTIFDLNVNLYEQPDALAGRFEYNAALFDERTAQRMAARFTGLLEAIADDPDRRIGSLPIIPESERSQIEEWNPAPVRMPATHETIHAWFEQQAAKTPGAPAVAAGGSSLSYAELNQRANDLAQRLRELGVTDGDRVAIRFPRSADAIVAIIAALKAGAAYVPLDSEYPADRLRFVIEDCGARVIVTPEGVRLLRSSTDPAPHGTAYIIYTSGSTGTPKGVRVAHQSLIYSTWARLQYYAEPVERYLLLSPLAFDSSVAGIFWTLCSGGCLEIATKEQMEDVPELAIGIKQKGVTHLLAVPSLYARLLDWFEASGLRLKVVIAAGEPCPPAMVSYHLERLPQVTLYNEYGPTEATVWSTVHRCCDEDAASVPIGRPIPNARAYVVDRNGEPVPIGVPGELWIGGPGVAGGYWNRPELTAECFIPDHFTFGGALLYRTGDLVKYRNADGSLVFLGRLDNQVKVRGYRVELGEIESALLAHPAVAECAAFTWRFEDDTRLAVWAVASGERIPSDELCAFLRRGLPSYMVPPWITWVDTLPRNANGKLDRRAMAANPQRFDAESYVLPRTPVEKTLACLYQEVLGLPETGIHANFFRLGGHSLLATRLLSRVNKTFQIDLPLPLLFRASTIAELAMEVERALVEEIGKLDEYDAERLAKEGYQ